ncbi:MAG: aldolase/citrate lyase family protein [Gemmatimonadota bacterium]|nr:aldolase/citrate lyase family protein [Gemmatimonadota bacterium]
MKNQLKEKLRNGEVTYGISIGTPCLDIVEMTSKMPFDWIWFDAEHAPLNVEILEPMLQVARGGDITPLVRVPWNDMVHIKKALDIGAEGLIIPWVNNREQAEMAVKAAKYPPMGLRGVGPKFINVTGDDLAEYIRTANDEGFVMVQIETTEAVDNLEEILTTPGVDAFLIGPSDLAASMGHLGDMVHPAVQDKIAEIMERAKKIGVPGGFAATTIETNKLRVEQGFQWITLGSDLTFLRQAADGALAEFGRK